jgi:hypothetical protein
MLGLTFPYELPHTHMPTTTFSAGFNSPSNGHLAMPLSINCVGVPMNQDLALGRGHMAPMRPTPPLDKVLAA